MLELTTFYIAARCARTGMLGAAVSTAVPGVGALCPFVGAGVGAVCTQSWVNPYLGIDGVAAAGSKDLDAAALLLTTQDQVKQTVAGVADYGGSLDVILDDAEEA